MDKLDIGILREIFLDIQTYPLQSNVRKSFEEIAKRLHVDKSTVRNRIRNLQMSGFLKDWRMFPNPSLFDLKVAYCRCTVHPSSAKEDVIRRIRLVWGVYAIINHIRDSMRVVLYYDDPESLKKQIELIKEVSNSDNMRTSEVYFPDVRIKLTERDWRVLRSLQVNPRKPLRLIAQETNMSSRTVRRRLTRMMKEGVLYIIPSLNPGSLHGGILAELVVFTENPRTRGGLSRVIQSHIDDYLLFPIIGDPEGLVFMLFLASAADGKKILQSTGEIDGVDAVYLDLVDERIESYETFTRFLDKKVPLR